MDKKQQAVKSAPAQPKKKSTLTKAEEKAIRKRIAQLTGKQKISVQRTIPYISMNRSGVCQLDEKTYSRTIQFGDINYQLASEDQQDEIFEAYCSILNYFDETVKFQLTFENQNTDVAHLKRSMEIPQAGDAFDEIRKEYSEMLSRQLEQGTNGRRLRKYLTFTVEADSPAAAKIRLDNIASELKKMFKAFRVKSSVLNGEQRLAGLYRSLNPFEKQPFIFDWVTKERGGFSSKDFISPPSLVLKKSSFELGSAHGGVASLSIVGSELSDRILNDFTRDDNIVAINIHARPFDQVAALKYCRQKLSDVEKSKIDEQKKASRSGYDMNILPPSIQMYIDDLEKLLKDLNEKNERLFHITLTIRYYAESAKKLQLLQEKLLRTAQKNNCRFVKLEYLQEAALASSLALGYNAVPQSRGMTTSSFAVFMPFTTEELFQNPTATYYGLNALTRNMIMASRLVLNNPNGLFLGTPGSGKSFSVKREIFDVFLRTDADILINDPEGEYYPMVEALHGQVVKISTTSGNYINPMDIPIEGFSGEDIIASKSDFLISFCSLIVGEYALQPDEISLIDKCVRYIYQMFLSNHPTPDKMPMLEDLQRTLLEQSQAKENNGLGKRIADSMDMYTHGSHNFFNHRSTVNISNRLVCFDIKDMGDQLRKLAMLVIQDEVWNRVTVNRGTGKKTWYYIDEFHLLLREKQTAAYSVEMWKRFRKWSGVPTGITQNVKDLITSAGADSVLSNSEFIYLLSQSAEDRAILAQQKELSAEQQEFITNSQPGHGLLIYSGTVIPFEDKFPEDTRMFNLMDTKPKSKKVAATAS